MKLPLFGKRQSPEEIHEEVTREIEALVRSGEKPPPPSWTLASGLPSSEVAPPPPPPLPLPADVGEPGAAYEDAGTETPVALETLDDDDPAFEPVEAPVAAETPPAPGRRRPAPARPAPAKTGSAKTGSARTGSARTGSARTGSDRTGSDKAGSARTGSAKTGSAKAKSASSKTGTPRAAAAKTGTATKSRSTGARSSGTGAASRRKR